MPKRKLKVIHIHTDLKFIKGTGHYEGNYFENTILIINNEKQDKDLLNLTTIYYSRSKKNIDDITALCNKYDLVVLYDLCWLKISLVKKINPTIKIAWRFFGHELYHKIPKYVYSEATLEINKKSWIKKGKKKLKSLFFNSEGVFNKTIKRIDYFLCYSKEEYFFLKNYWPHLPKLIKIPINNFNESQIKIPYNKEHLVIIGNSKIAYNNHIDIINYITISEIDEKINFKLLFNYDRENSYTYSIRRSVSEKPKFQLINNFLNNTEFIELYSKASSLVINSHRQMALGNIFAAFRNGVKVYLNKKNITFEWFRNENLKVFSIEDFKDDITNENIFLSPADIKHNINQIERLSFTYSVTDFQKQLYNLLIDKR